MEELTKVIERIKNEDRRWSKAKRTGKLTIEINYALGGISNTYVTSTSKLNSVKPNTE